ncbi:MAG: DUF1016 N-terminal domain-containing protein [bacterium]
MTKILTKGRSLAVAAVSKILVETYWEVGRRLSLELESQVDSGATAFFAQLGKDLGVGTTVIHDAWKFYRTYPEGLPTGRGFRTLSWGAHTALLPIADPKARTFYLERAVEEGWSRPKLRKAIRADLYGAVTATDTNKDPAAAPRLERAPRDLHNYVGVLDRVIDGDTIKVRIDLGFDVWRVETIRLRGVDTPEGGTALAQRAKKFVADKLSRAPFIGLRTYKTDKYARYIADVYYHTEKTSPDVTFEKGVFLNQELLDKGLAARLYIPV